ncbi:MAG: thioredoxin family protein [Lewinellaceae bacterium]|nr:thioredoxin family protein [Lewinellaceae bacterium]
MKSSFFALLLLFMGAQTTFAEGIEFYHGSWDEAKEMAKTQQKLIFVDAFASWCGPCKRMASTVFVLPEVGEFYNANFICLKIDMEKPENAAFASKYPVSAYPTLMFINAEGKIVLKEVGGKPADALIEMGKKALGMMDNLPDMDAQYEAGNREPNFIYTYVKALNRSGKPSLKYTNEYLMTQSDLRSEFNRRFIFEGAVEADSRVFDLLLEQKSDIAALMSAEAVDARIEQACQKTVRKAVGFRSETLLKEAKDKMKKGIPDRADAFASTADLQFYAATKDVKNYLKAAQGYQKKTVKNNAAQLNSLAELMSRDFPADAKVLGQAVKWQESAAKFGGLPEYYLTLADLYKRLGKKDQALLAARKGIDLMGDKQDALRQVLDSFIRNIDRA